MLYIIIKRWYVVLIKITYHNMRTSINTEKARGP